MSAATRQAADDARNGSNAFPSHPEAGAVDESTVLTDQYAINAVNSASGIGSSAAANVDWGAGGVGVDGPALAIAQRIGIAARVAVAPGARVAGDGAGAGSGAVALGGDGAGGGAVALGGAGAVASGAVALGGAGVAGDGGASAVVALKDAGVVGGGAASGAVALSGAGVGGQSGVVARPDGVVGGRRA
jgi:hypothetical protein